MPSNKNAIIRYRTLDRCLRNTGRRYYLSDLLSACAAALSEFSGKPQQVSRRTVLNDLSFMESEAGWGSVGLEIERLRDEGGRRVYYRYADPHFSIDNTPLSSAELSQLEQAVVTLSQFRGLPQFEWIESLLHRLSFTGDGQTPQIVGFESNPYLRGLEWVEPLYRAIRNRTVLRVRYRSFRWPEPQTFTLHPYFLKEYNSRWFLFGLNAEYGHPTWSMALDRIEDVQALAQQPYQADETDWEEYFSDIIGVTHPAEGDVEEVVLQCDRLCGRYVETKPLHESQRHRWQDEDCLEVTLRVMVNAELESTILRHGEGMTVVRPVWLRERIASRLRASLRHYAVPAVVPTAEEQ